MTTVTADLATAAPVFPRALPADVQDFLNYKGADQGLTESERESYSNLLSEFCAFLETHPKPAPAPSISHSPYDGVLAYLELAQARERNPNLRADVRQSWLYVLYESQGNPIAFVEASYVVHGYHPDKLWPQIVKNRKGILGAEYDCWYDPSGKLIPEWLVADYDPTSKLRIATPQLGLMYQMSAPCWPTEYDSLRNPQGAESARQPQIPGASADRLAWTDGRSRPKAPLRRVVNWTEIPTRNIVLPPGRTRVRPFAY